MLIFRDSNFEAVIWGYTIEDKILFTVAFDTVLHFSNYYKIWVTWMCSEMPEVWKFWRVKAIFEERQNREIDICAAVEACEPYMTELIGLFWKWMGTITIKCKKVMKLFSWTTLDGRVFVNPRKKNFLTYCSHISHRFLYTRITIHPL